MPQYIILLYDDPKKFAELSPQEMQEAFKKYYDRTLAKIAVAEELKKGWLGGRDSNPDRQIQNLQSYRWTTSQ